MNNHFCRDNSDSILNASSDDFKDYKNIASSSLFFFHKSFKEGMDIS